MNRRDFIARSLIGGAAAATSFGALSAAALQNPPSPPAPAARRREASLPITSVPVAPGHIMLTGAGGNVSVLFADDAPTTVIDAGLPNTSQELLTAAKAASGKDINTLINTHYHFDHSGGNEAFGLAGAGIVASKNCHARLISSQFIEQFNLRTEPAAPKARPTVVLPNGGSLSVGSETLELVALPPAHTDGDLAILIKPSNVLHTGDLFFNGFYPFIDYDAGGSISAMVAAADILLGRIDDSTTIVPGHGPLAKKADYQAFRDMLAKLSDRLNALADQGKSVEEALATNPTADTDEKWGSGLFKGPVFAGFVYKGELKRRGK